MKERPILFSAPMVRAILNGTKTQTRRIAKPVKHPDLGNLYTPGALVREHESQHVIDRACPYGQPGDRIWVRETWRYIEGGAIYDAAGGVMDAFEPETIYLADRPTTAGPWKPSIHMPRWASRITLEITGVRVERLQDISEADAKAEGTPGGHGSIPGYGYNAMAYEHYRWLWEEINGAGSWDANPWVWVVEFKRVEGGEA